MREVTDVRCCETRRGVVTVGGVNPRLPERCDGFCVQAVPGKDAPVTVAVMGMVALCRAVNG